MEQFEAQRVELVEQDKRQKEEIEQLKIEVGEAGEAKKRLLQDRENTTLRKNQLKEQTTNAKERIALGETVQKQLQRKCVEVQSQLEVCPDQTRVNSNMVCGCAEPPQVSRDSARICRTRGQDR